MSLITDTEIILELKRIADNNSGILRAEDIVEVAKSKDSPLHNRFEWDDTEAAHQYRLYQARNIIRVSVEMIGGEKGQMSRVFVSLKTDRSETGGGYRAMLAIMSDPQRRSQMLQEALDELDSFQKKYQMLDELAKVFEAIESTKETVKTDNQIAI